MELLPIGPMGEDGERYNAYLQAHSAAETPMSGADRDAQTVANGGGGFTGHPEPNEH